MEKTAVHKLLTSLQKYGLECPMVENNEVYRQGWTDAIKELKRQLRRLA